MKEILVDTSAWAAIADSGDVNHSAAMALKDKIAGEYRIVVTDYILDEARTAYRSSR